MSSALRLDPLPFGPPSPASRALLDRLVAALAARGVVTEEEIAAGQAAMDAASPELGARMVARAWVEPDYRALLLGDGTAGAEAVGISTTGMPPLGVLENTPHLHNLVVCTLCSCYPRAILGYPPAWYTSATYRARAVREPRALLTEWGVNLPEAVRVRVVDSTADWRWMVLPMRPAGTEDWDEARLAALVTREAMVGMALVVAP
jgi:nitrile hydratase